MNSYDSGDYITSMLGLYNKRYSYHIVYTQHTSDLRHFGTGAEVSGHFDTSAEMS